jgi:predicted XRE-type DNA-binding protein
MITERQFEIVTGSLLGDGTIWTNFVDPLMKWQLGQSKCDHLGVDKSQYMLWYVKEFLQFGCSIRPKISKWKDKEFPSYVFYTRCNKLWNGVESQWYAPRVDHPRFKRRKIVPQDLKLTPLTLCVWHMDDGSNYAKDANITLETQGFTPEEVDFLIERLDKDLDIKSKKKKTKKESQFRIYVGRKSYFDFIEMIKPHIEWSCFKYKTDTGGYGKVSQIGESHSQAKINEEIVKTVFELHNKGLLQKEISSKVKVSQANISMILSRKRWGHVSV